MPARRAARTPPRAADLGLDRLRPWDLRGRPAGTARRCGRSTRATSTASSTRRARSSPACRRTWRRTSTGSRDQKTLDLESRKGKQPGGYQCSLEESRQPFIFMNAAGLQRDVETLLHEGGHAFHYLAAADEPVFLRSAPMEFCEVASMSMELLGSEHFDVFYDEADAARAKPQAVRGDHPLLPVDGDDRLVPALDLHAPRPLARAERTGEWLRLLDRFAPGIDWAGYEPARESLLAAAAAPVPRAVLLHRVRHRAARRAAAVDEEPRGPARGRWPATARRWRWAAPGRCPSCSPPPASTSISRSGPCAR